MVSAAMYLFLAALGAGPTPREVAGTEALVRADLAARRAPDASVEYQPAPSLAAAFPGYMFVLAEFPTVPPAGLPRPLARRSLYAVSAAGEVRLLGTPEDVLGLLGEALPPVKTAADAARAAEAAAALEQAKYPEQEFAPPPGGFQARPDKAGGFQAGGAVQPAPRAGQPAAAPAGTPGTGPIAVQLNFGPAGRPQKVVTNNNYTPDRPTRPARPPRQQVAKAAPAAEKEAGGPVTNVNAPVVNKVAPGTTVFAPRPARDPKGLDPKAADPKAADPKNSKGGSPKEGIGRLKPTPIVAVGSDGKPRTLDNSHVAARFLVEQAAPVATEEKAREVMEAAAELYAALHPSLPLAAVRSGDVAATSVRKGGIDVTARLYSRDGAGFVALKLAINMKGEFRGWDVDTDKWDTGK